MSAVKVVYTVPSCWNRPRSLLLRCRIHHGVIGSGQLLTGGVIVEGIGAAQLRLECLQNIVELIHGGGNLHVHLLQPVGADDIALHLGKTVVNLAELKNLTVVGAAAVSRSASSDSSRR